MSRLLARCLIALLPLGAASLVPRYLHPLEDGTIKIAKDPTEASALERFRACVSG